MLQLEVLDDEQEVDDYIVNFHCMFGKPPMDAVMESVGGGLRLLGLPPRSMALEGLDRRRRLIDSHKKLHTAQAGVVASSGPG